MLTAGHEQRKGRWHMKPRRSILSVPGHIEKMHAKARESAADVVMLDLEDSVPMDAKEAARAQVIRSLATMDWQNKIISVRCNGLETPFGYRDILEVGEHAGHVLDTMVIPKVHHPGDVHFVHRMFDGIEMNKGIDKKIGIEASIESAKGLENVTRIAGSSDRIRSLVFGVADYSESIGARLVSISGHGEGEDDIYPGHRWHFPLSRIIMAARANGLAAIDAPFGNFKDRDGLRRSAAMTSALGYNGKWVIHPSQIDIVNEIYSPSIEDIERAKKIIRAHEEAVQSGRGAVAVEGRMVDNATIRLAEKIMAQAEYLKRERSGEK
jgi:malyl-CoA/(S)-citramalyl-CoA lyase